MTKKQNGFTIVELLIVIVVIGILAALTTIGTGRYQRNARNQSKIVAAQGLSTSLRTYLGEFNKYPMKRHTCLGYGDDYSADGDYCMFFSLDGGVTQSANGNFRVRNEFNKELAKVTTEARPKMNTEPIGGNLGSAYVLMGGINFNYNEPVSGYTGGTVKDSDNVVYDHWYFIQYILEGNNEDCGVTTVKYEGDINNFTISDGKNSFSDGTNTLCISALPDPEHPDSPIN